MEKLAELSVIDGESALRLGRAVRMRNLIVHQLLGGLRALRVDFLSFQERVLSWMGENA
ncbi:MAG: hypothetical protein Kow0069_14540 [Promethearchaeota archaeon]